MFLFSLIPLSNKYLERGLIKRLSTILPIPLAPFERLLSDSSKSIFTASSESLILILFF